MLCGEEKLRGRSRSPMISGGQWKEMGTREVYEEKLRRGNMYDYDPTLKPGLGSPRCPRCLSLLNPISGDDEWKITSVLQDATAVAGSGIGGLLTAVHGFNTGMPYVQKHVKGPKWIQFVVGLPPLLAYSATGAAFGGYALPRFTQLSVTSYYAALSASNYCVSLLTRRIEKAHDSACQRENCS